MPKNDQRNRGIVPIGNVIQNILKSDRLRANTSIVRVWDIWQNTVGDLIAANTEPAAFKGNLLVVHTTSSSWIQQLRFLKLDIISKINQALGEELVHDIKFKIGRVK